MLVYGQTEIEKDLADAVVARVVRDANDVAIQGFDGSVPRVAYVKNGVPQEIRCVGKLQRMGLTAHPLSF